MYKEKTSKLSFDNKPRLDLIDLLKRKIKVLTQYKEITLALDSKIDSGKTEEVSLLLDQRQGLIEEIIEIDERIKKIRSESEDHSESKNRSKKEILRLNQKLLIEIEGLDQLCVMKLSQKQNGIRSQLSEIHNKFRTAGFYLKYPIEPPRFLDIRK